jgi:HlyD family secretion protein
MKRRILILIAVVILIALCLQWYINHRPRDLVVTGIVTTDSVVVSSEVQGRIEKLLVKEGDVVKRGDLLGVIQPKEWNADMSYYANNENMSLAQVTQAQADLRYQEEQTTNQILQAEANLASARDQVRQGEADLENAQLNATRFAGLFRQGVESASSNDQARSTFLANQAHVESLRKQELAAEAALALARSTAVQIAARRAAVAAMNDQLAAAGAQREKAQVRLDYTEIHAPIDGVVDVRAALMGEVVTPGEAIVTLVDPDNLWIRADVEEGYIDQVRLGDKMKVRLPSGAEREGVVTYRGTDADYATQRDVSRTKRDIKTFEIRLRCDNKDRRLALGMTAYVTLTLAKH